MTDFENRLASNIDQHALLRPEAPVIVAVSGGADSVALLAGLCALGYTCVAAHCNFHLRGEESNRDMRHVQSLCRALEVDLYIRDFDVHSRCEQTGESVEMACRALRYDWFGDLLDKLRAQAIAVAHHREDNVETFFLNLMRGSSITGLTGMRWRNAYVVRPLLDMSRADIEGYLRERGIGWVDDSTNAESLYARNRLRNVVLPVLAEHFPGALAGILNSISYLADNRQLYEQAVREKSDLYMQGGRIHLAELLRDQPLARLLLFEMLRPLGFNMSQVDDIIAAAQGGQAASPRPPGEKAGSHGSGKVFSAGATSLELDRGVLNIVSRTRYTPDEVEVSLHRDILTPVNITVTDRPVTDFHPLRNPAIAFFDAQILAGNPRFALRRWRRGDRITPFGMRGSRLLSDIFSDAKLSASDKRNVWLLTRDGDIIWVVGIRATDRYPVTPDTRRYLMLTLHD